MSDTLENEVRTLNCPHCRTHLMTVEREGSTYLTEESLTHFKICQEDKRVEEYLARYMSDEIDKNGKPVDNFQEDV